MTGRRGAPRAGYLMESGDEAIRLDLKTDRDDVARQARWAGLAPGMRVADLGCGSGKTTAVLHEVAGPGAEAVGVDLSPERIAFASERYGAPGRRFVLGDIRGPLPEAGLFDFVWVRFVLEYYLRESAAIVANVASLVRPGGLICLADLDNNCLCHHEIPPRLERSIASLMGLLAREANFDAYAGRKLYAHLYDLGCAEIRVHVEGHHLIYGPLRHQDAYNWMKKVEVAPRKVGFDFAEYGGGYDEFREEFDRFFADPRRFTYSPLVICRGRVAGRRGRAA